MLCVLCSGGFSSVPNNPNPTVVRADWPPASWPIAVRGAQGPIVEVPLAPSGSRREKPSAAATMISNGSGVLACELAGKRVCLSEFCDSLRERICEFLVLSCARKARDRNSRSDRYRLQLDSSARRV